VGEAAKNQLVSDLVVTLTQDQLRALIGEAVRTAISNANASKVQGSENEYLDTRQAAKVLGISVAALKSRVWRGSIEPDHLGGTDGLKGNRFHRSTLDAYLTRNRGK
jgi:hypothetical protein